MEIGNHIDFHGSDGDTSDFGNGRFYGGSSLHSDRNFAATSFRTYSDKMLNSIADADLVDFIKECRPVTYKWNDTNLDTKTHYGLIAQEIEDIIIARGKTIEEIGLLVKDNDKMLDGTDVPIVLLYSTYIYFNKSGANVSQNRSIRSKSRVTKLIHLYSNTK